MFSIKTLQENINTDNFVLNDIVQDNRSPVYDLLEYNDQIHDLENEFDRKYYGALCEASINGLSTLNEGIISDLTEKIAEIVRRIIEGIKNFFRKLTGNYKEAEAKYEEVKHNSHGFKVEFDEKMYDEMFKRWKAKGNKASQEAYERNKEEAKKKVERVDETEHTFEIWEYPHEIDDQAPRACLREMTTWIDRFCKADDTLNPNNFSKENLEDTLKATFRGLSAGTQGKRKDYKGKISNEKEYMKYIQTDVVYMNRVTMKYKEWREKYANEIMKLPEGFAKKQEDAMIGELKTAEAKLENSSKKMSKEQIDACSNVISCIRSIVSAWNSYIGYVCKIHKQNLEYTINKYNQINRNIYGFSESTTMFGEPFEGEVLFDNEDLYDFNRTEWLDLSITTECYNLKYEIKEAQRRICLQEALILSDDDPVKVKRLIAMKEAEEGRVRETIRNIIDKIKEIFNKFLDLFRKKVLDVQGFIKDNEKAIREKKFADDMKITSKGDILAGMYRIKDPINFKEFSFEQMKDDLKDKKTFFGKEIAPTLNKSSNFTKRTGINWDPNKMEIADFCKSYFGASIENDTFKKCEFTGKEFEANKENIITFLKNSETYINSANQDINKLDEQSKKVSATNNEQPKQDNKANDNVKAGEQKQGEATNNAQTAGKQEAYYSLLYDKVITEAEVSGGDTAQNGNQSNNSGSTTPTDEASAFKIYTEAYQDVLTSKITAIEFITVEMADIFSSLIGVKIKKKVAENKDEKKK